MRRPTATTVGLLCFALTTSALAQQAGSDVRAALEELHSWIGDGEKGRRWRAHLRSAEIEEQLARGESANRSVVERFHQLYSADTAGLERRRFVSVKTAIGRWLDELPEGGGQDLSALAAAESDGYEPVPEEYVAKKKAALISAARALEDFLAGGTEANAAQWKTYLKWEELNEQLTTDGETDLNVLTPVLARFRAKHTGLELPEFTAVRESLRDYMNAVFFRRQSALPERFAQRIGDLSRHLGEFQATGETEAAHTIGRILGWLDSGNQSSELVSKVRQKFGNPNLYAQVSERLLSAGVEAPIDEMQNVHENILGTSIHGVAHMQGQIGLELVPSAEQATFDIEMSGVASGSNVGYNGPVTICSYGVTQVYSAKRIYLGPTGLRSDRAYANCTTSSNINGIGARSKIVEKIAWKRAGKLKPKSEAIAARRAEARVARRFDSQAADLLADANGQYKDKVRNPLLRQDAFPGDIRFGSDADNLRVDVVHANPYQLAAAGSPPQLNEANDISLQLHESMIGNFSESLLGGQTLTDERLVELLTEAGGEVPEELAIGPEKDPWSISFSSDRPVSATFAADRVRLAIRGRRFTRGDQEIRNTIEISATYQLEATGTGSRLNRQGEIEVAYLNQGSLSVTQVAMKTFLSRKFDALFKEEIVGDGLSLPGKWERLGKLHLNQLLSGSHWLTMGWKLQPDSAQTAGTDSEPAPTGG